MFINRGYRANRLRCGAHHRKRFDEVHVKALMTTSPQRVTPLAATSDTAAGVIAHLAADAQRAHKREVVSELMAARHTAWRGGGDSGQSGKVTADGRG